MADETTETFTTERAFACPPQDVWDAITDAEKLSVVFDAPVDFTPEAGAEGTIELSEADGGTRVLLVEEVVEGERLTLRWASLTEAPTRVTFDIAPSGNGTRLVITERSLQPTMMLAGAR
ncbi:MAG: SRPBCC domain-containing protein [Acidimicrobiales bacterium]